MRIRKYAAIAAALAVLLTVFMLTAAQSDSDSVAYYSVEGVYNAEDQTYTAEIYLNTKEYLSVGTFGIEYDDTLSPELTLNSQFHNLELSETYPDLTPEYLSQFDLSDKNYIVFRWAMDYNEEYTYSEMEKIPFATITLENVESARGVPKDWTMETFRQLDWRTTPMAEADMFKENLEDEELSLNDEIWRTLDDTEKESLKTLIIDTAEDGLTGYYKVLKSHVTDGEADENGNSEPELTVPDGFYQGYAFYSDEENDYDKWVDIGFEFTTDPSLDQTYILLTGTVTGYNENNPITVTAYKKDETEETDTVEIDEFDPISEIGMVTGTYTLSVPEAGEYTLKFEKDVHLTYTMDVTVEDVEEQTVDDVVKLYCGDIKADERIKQEDRSYLMKYMNKQLYNGEVEDAKRCDLNGDGKVNQRDLDIFKLFYNKSYEGAD